MVITPKRQKGEFYSQSRVAQFISNTIKKAVFYLIHFPASFIRLWPSCHPDLRGSRHGLGLFVEQIDMFSTPFALFQCILRNLAKDCQPRFRLAVILFIASSQ